MAFEEKLKNMEPDEQAVFAVLDEIGPACDRRILEALNQKEARRLGGQHQRRYWEINQVCGRRNGLVNLNVVRDMGIYCGTWYGKKKKYHFWKVAGDLREPPAGWKKYEGRVARKYSGVGTQKTEGQKTEHRTSNAELRTSNTERCTLSATSMDVHEAGRIMVEWRRMGKRKINQPTKQLVMF